jgi:ferric-dicitrate binding protein FerR (iron transport regulator)
MADQLPHNEQNQQLARLIEDSLESGRSLQNIDHEDELLDMLLAYKQDSATFEVNRNEKQEVWQRISSQTADSATISTLFSSSMIRWAAAAVILIGSLVGGFYLQYYQQPEIIGQSQTSLSTIELDSGSTVTLRPHSRLYSLEQRNGSHQYKLEGEALFNITPDPNRTFSVETEIGRVSVLGTSFTVSSWGQQMQVFLQEGSLAVQALNQDSSIVLQPGQSASLASKNNRPNVDTARVEEFFDWLDRKVVFEKRSVSMVTSEIEQHFDIRISLPDNTRDNKLTGQLSLQNLESALRDLEIVLGGQFSKTGTRSYTFETD